MGSLSMTSRYATDLDVLRAARVDARVAGWSSRSHALRSGRRKCQSVACWNARPARIRVASVKGAPINCRPIGRPSLDIPPGSDSAHAVR